MSLLTALKTHQNWHRR